MPPFPHLVLVLCASITIFTPTNPYFVMGRMWEKIDEKGKRHFVVALGDCHDAHEQMNQQLIDLMCSIPKDSLVVVESMVDLWINNLPNGSDLSYTAKLKCYEENVSPIDTPLDTIIYISSKIKIDFINIEFRDYIGPFDWVCTNNTKYSKPPTFNCMIDVMREFTKNNREHLKNIEKLTGGKLEYVYEKNSELVTECNNFLDNYADLIESLEVRDQEFDIEILKNRFNYFYTHSPNFFSLSFLKQFVVNVRSFILDSYILNALEMNQCRPFIFICAGAGHITRIEDAVQQLGYKPVENKKFGTEEDRQPISVKKLLEPHFKPVRQVDHKGNPPSTGSYINFFAEWFLASWLGGGHYFLLKYLWN